MKFKYNKILMLIALLFASVSCNEWLDVKPQGEVDSEEMFSYESGYKDALIGVYLSMRNHYENDMVMTSVEYLAQHWEDRDLEYIENFKDFDYDTDYSEYLIKNIYLNLYNIVTKANDIINHLEENGDEVFNDKDLRNVIEGEARALRAYVQLDILRLFGQVPTADAATTVDLAYSYDVSVETPEKVDFDTYVTKLLADLTKAEYLLYESDPIVNYTFSELDNSQALTYNKVEDDYFLYRRLRLNYWAVKALKARAYLWAGKTTEANAEALSVINSLVENENSTGYNGSFISFNTSTDFSNGYYSKPSETLFQFDVFDITDYTDGYFVGDELTLYATTDQSLYYNSIFNGQTTDARHNAWYGVISTQSTTNYTIKKYNQPTDDSDRIFGMNAVIPLIRLSEVYLIAAETSSDMVTANALFKTYRASNDIIHVDVSDEESLKSEILKEYNVEFYGEGQMFYAYKRMNSKSMVFKTEEILEENYILPIPNQVVD